MFDARGVDFDRDGKIGAVDAVRLPPGDCELFNFNLALAGNPRQAVQSQAGLLTSLHDPGRHRGPTSASASRSA
jgi:hypothetical protein